MPNCGCVCLWCFGWRSDQKKKQIKNRITARLLSVFNILKQEMNTIDVHASYDEFKRCKHTLNNHSIRGRKTKIYEKPKNWLHESACMYIFNTFKLTLRNRNEPFSSSHSHPVEKRSKGQCAICVRYINLRFLRDRMCKHIYTTSHFEQLHVVFVFFGLQQTQNPWHTATQRAYNTVSMCVTGSKEETAIEETCCANMKPIKTILKGL